MPANLLSTIPWRNTIKWIVIDLNEDEEANDLSAWMQQNLRTALDLQHIYYFRRRDPVKDPWRGWDCSVAKNCAGLAAEAICDFTDEPLSNAVIVNVDSDNIFGPPFIDMLMGHSKQMVKGELKGIFYRHPKVGSTTGRIACTMATFMKIGGYWEALLPCGSQDVFFMKCPSAEGKTTRVHSEAIGTAVQNNTDVRKGKRGFFRTDCAQKVANCNAEHAEMTWEEMNNVNWDKRKAFIRKALVFPVNGADQAIGIDINESPLTVTGSTS